MSHEIKAFYKFGEFRFDIDKHVLWRGDEIVALTPKATEVLYMLLRERGNLVERQELLEQVWSGTFVEEGNLNHAISALRRSLGDGMIQTVPRRGYRFAAEVREVSEDPVPDIVIEKRSVSNTVIEEREEIIDDSRSAPALTAGEAADLRRRYRGVAVVLVLLAGLTTGGWYFVSGSFGSLKADRSSIRSIAVMPLRSFSDEADEELRLRITDALITKLNTLDNIVVRPTNAVLRFVGENQDVVEAGRQLGVDAVLDGRVQEENGRLRVTLQLVSVTGGEQLWSGQFDGRVGEILALQDMISSRLKRDFVLADSKEANRRPVVNNESYEAYLKGRYVWNQRRKESYFKALEYFQKSVEIDPNFALGYTGIADCYYLLQQRNVLSTREAFEKAEKAARRALELDPNLSEAHSSMGAVSLLRYSRWTEAENYYKRAIELNPNLAEPHGRLGMLYNAWGRFDEAYAVLSRAEELDPTSRNIAIYLGANYYFSKQFGRAESQFKRILEFSPGTERAHFFLYRIYEILGRYDEAVEHALKEREIFRPDSVEPLRLAFRNGGIRAFWLKQADYMIEESKEMHGLENHIASRFVLLGDKKRACDYVEKNLEALGSMQNYGRVDPIFDPLRSDPRFIKLMQHTHEVK